jgi:CspA family cold shock protein
MATGKVKWFNNAKGYGFILPEQGGEDLFAHYSMIQMDGYKTLRAGQDVVFDVEAGPKGMHAVNIRASTAPDSVAAEVSTTVNAITNPAPLRAAFAMEDAPPVPA